MSAEVLQRAFASTRGVLANVSADQMDLPPPCASWSVRDVVNHIVGGTTYFAVTAETGTAPSVRDADHAAGDFKAQFDEGAQRAVEGFSAEGAMEKPMKRVHLDLWVDDLDASIALVERLGGTHTGEAQTVPEGTNAVMADPEGTEFCVFALRSQ